MLNQDFSTDKIYTKINADFATKEARIEVIIVKGSKMLAKIYK